MRQKVVAPVALRKGAAIFCCALAQRRSRWAWSFVSNQQEVLHLATHCCCSCSATPAQSRPIGIKNSCARGAPPQMKGAPLLLTWFLLGRDFQKNLRRSSKRNWPSDGSRVGAEEEL